MNPLIPYIDSSELDSNGLCYYFIDDNIVVTFDDETSKVYKLINDKIYLSNDVVTINNSNSTPSSPSTPEVTCNNLFDLSSINNTSARGILASYNSTSDSLSFTGSSNFNSSPTRYLTNVTCDSSQTLYIKLNKVVPTGFRFYFTIWETQNGGAVYIPEDSDSASLSCSAGDKIYMWIIPSCGATCNGTTVNLSDFQISISTDENSSYCKYGSSDSPIPEPVITDCYSYTDICHIPHSMSGLSPFYCFLCVVIFMILLYVPYKIFIRPFFAKL